MAVNHNDPIFRSIFGRDWDALPPVMLKHYALAANSKTKHIAEGHLTVEVSPMIGLLARLTHMLVPYSGKDIPVTVVYYSGARSNAFHFDRCFHFPIQGDHHFKSRMITQCDDEVIEVMRFGIAWRLRYIFDQGKNSIIASRVLLACAGAKYPFAAGMVYRARACGRRGY